MTAPTKRRDASGKFAKPENPCGEDCPDCPDPCRVLCEPKRGCEEREG